MHTCNGIHVYRRHALLEAPKLSGASVHVSATCSRTTRVKLYTCTVSRCTCTRSTRAPRVSNVYTCTAEKSHVYCSVQYCTRMQRMTRVTKKTSPPCQIEHVYGKTDGTDLYSLNTCIQVVHVCNIAPGLSAHSPVQGTLAALLTQYTCNTCLAGLSLARKLYCAENKNISDTYTSHTVHSTYPRSA